MKKIGLILVSFVACHLVWGNPSFPKPERVFSSEVNTWFFKDGKTPLFSLVLYLDKGAFTDPMGKSGLTSSSLNLAFKGTDKYSEKEISEYFARYGASYSIDVKHEYTSLYLSGLIEDAKPLLKMFCHVLKEANYPQEKLNSYQKRLIAGAKNLETSPESIASLVFRAESLRAHKKLQIPSEGLLKDLKNLTPQALKKHLSFLMNEASRRLYISGPGKAKNLGRILSKECRWKENPKTSPVKPLKFTGRTQRKPRIFLVPVSDSNQAQVRVGRMIQGEAKNQDLVAMSVLKSYLAGAGFISELFTELRSKRGLTYSVRVFEDMQRNYGRSGVSTFTQNAKVSTMLKTLKSIFDKLSHKGFHNKERLKLVKKNLEGSYLFAYEKNENFLESLMYFQHIGKDESMIYLFPEKVKLVGPQRLQKVMVKDFSWNKLTIVVVGDRSLKKQLRRFGKVQIVDWKKYL